MLSAPTTVWPSSASTTQPIMVDSPVSSIQVSASVPSQTAPSAFGNVVFSTITRAMPASVRTLTYAISEPPLEASSFT